MTSDSEIIVDDILKNIKKSGGDLIMNVELFDIFDFEEKKEKSFAFRISFGSNERTLKNEEVDEAMEKITEKLEKDLKVKVRK
jgi:phenylalanyl-tRNA synthetase beta chain